MRIDFENDRQMVSSTRRAPRRQPWMALVTAVMRLAGDRAELIRHGETPWASITFSGSRHKIALAYRGAEAVAAGEAFISALSEHEFEIPGQLVADAAIASAEHELLPEPCLIVEAELLLLEEG